MRLLDIDPDLGAKLSLRAQEAATIESSVTTWVRSRGRWLEIDDLDPDVSLYVISGTLIHRVAVEGRTAVELFGPGQVMRPAAVGAEPRAITSSSWRVLAPSWLAVLDKAFWHAMRPYPGVSLGLMGREELRSRTLTFRLALAGVRNLRRRVMALLWHLAESWGRVGPKGVTLELTLSHEVLADLVSAHRSSVSKTVKELEREGKLTQTRSMSFILHPDADRGLGSPGLVSRLSLAVPLVSSLPVG